MFKICIFYKWFFIIKPYGRQTPSFVNPIVTSHFKSTQKKKMFTDISPQVLQTKNSRNL